ncbi:MAG: hypothetical protein K2H01_00425, partial [Ruminococcus sp.]|nr:hypothetical protein [Ruminococcus sp.]
QRQCIVSGVNRFGHQACASCHIHTVLSVYIFNQSVLQNKKDLNLHFITETQIKRTGVRFSKCSVPEYVSKIFAIQYVRLLRDNLLSRHFI